MKKNDTTTNNNKSITIQPTDMFAEAKIRAQQNRHSQLDEIFDSSLNVLSEIIGNPQLSSAEKMFPAKTVIDAYMTKEKLSREDAKYDIEKAKLEIERAKIEIEKAKLSMPGGPLYVVQNIQTQQNNTVISTDSTARKALQDRKLKQAQLLEEASGISQFPKDIETKS